MKIDDVGGQICQYFDGRFEDCRDCIRWKQFTEKPCFVPTDAYQQGEVDVDVDGIDEDGQQELALHNIDRSNPSPRELVWLHEHGYLRRRWMDFVVVFIPYMAILQVLFSLDAVYEPGNTILAFLVLGVYALLVLVIVDGVKKIVVSEYYRRKHQRRQDETTTRREDDRQSVEERQGDDRDE